MLLDVLEAELPALSEQFPAHVKNFVDLLFRLTVVQVLMAVEIFVLQTVLLQWLLQRIDIVDWADDSSGMFPLQGNTPHHS